MYADNLYCIMQIRAVTFNWQKAFANPNYSKRNLDFDIEILDKLIFLYIIKILRFDFLVIFQSRDWKWVVFELQSLR